MPEEISNNETLLYQLIQRNITQDAMAILDVLPQLKFRCNNRNEMKTVGEDSTVWSMLQWACYHGNEKIVQSLLFHSKNIKLNFEHKKENFNAVSPSNSLFTPLHVAVQKNHLNICWLLILSYNSLEDEQKCNDGNMITVVLDQTDKWGNTPLHTAAANGNYRLVKWLLDIGADTSKKNIYNFTAMDVTTNNDCRSLLRNNGQESSVVKIRESMAKEMIKKYFQFKARLEELINTSLEEICKNFELHHVQHLIDCAIYFGLEKDLANKCLDRMVWLKMMKEFIRQKKDLEDIAPILSSNDYEYVKELQLLINQANKKCTNNEVPTEIANMIADSSALCYRSSTEFNLNKVCQECQQIPSANETHESKMEILKTAIEAAKIANGNKKLIEDADNISLKLISELHLRQAIKNMPNPRLPLPDMMSKQATSYWGEVDLGNIKETEGYPLPPPGGQGYVWIKSESLQCLESSINELRNFINEAEAHEANSELIRSSKSILKKKCDVDLKLLHDKNEADYKAALLIIEKAAKKIMKKKKGKKK